MNNIDSFCFCVTSRDNWPAWCAMNSDLPADADYDTWLENVNEFEQQIRSQGQLPVRVYVEPQEFVAWCRARGRNIDSTTRGEYAAFVRIND